MPRYLRETSLIPYYNSRPDYRSPVSEDELDFILAATGVDLAGVRTCLDLGCGDGRWCRMLARRGVSCVGVDYSAVRIEKARRASAGLPVDYVCRDLHEFLQEDRGSRIEGRGCKIEDRHDRQSSILDPRPFDLVCLFEVLEHLEQPASVVQAARRLGPLIGSVPLKHPDPAHLQVFADEADVRRRLAPDQIVRWKRRYVLCRWEPEIADDES